MAVVRLGTCSWADEGLLKNWYPREARTAEARLRYYAERFDTVEVDSPFYRLPSVEVATNWAERTPAGFVFHAKASKQMTGHEETDSRERSFAEFRESLAPLERSGKLRGVLLQFHPRFVKSREALDELRGVAELLAPLVPLIEFRHRSWMTEDERAETLSFLERHGLAYVSVDSPPTRASNVLPRVAEEGHELEEWSMVSEQGPPRPLDEYDAVLVFGGHMNVDQEREHPWLTEEDELIRGLVERRVPLFGVCLGGQLLAKAAGAPVGPLTEAERGFVRVTLSNEAATDPVFGALPHEFDVFEAHG